MAMERNSPTKRILIVEDEFLVAEDMAYEVRALGLEVVGPIENVAAALKTIFETGGIDGALLDINVGGDLTFPIADALLERGIPLAFTTGYDENNVPEKYAGVACYSKPITRSILRKALTDQVG